jgi:His/Glu/Gln/Arg/opine family amino acid ABC transporter permease subunit
MQFDLNIFWQQLFSSAYLFGALTALGLAVASQLVAIVIGFVLAVARTSPNGVARAVSGGYVWFFRAIPTLLVLLIVWNAGPQLIPALTQTWFTPFLAAFIGLAVVEGAYMAEIIRSALLSIDDGQPLAARALGMTPWQVMRKVLIPQATRIAIPPTGNEFIGMVKYTSLASVISLKELLTTAQIGVSVTFRYAEYYAAAIVYYLIIVSILMIIQNRIERRFQWTTKTAKLSRVARGKTVPEKAVAA